MTPIVETRLGKVSGESLGDHVRFRGIPYAAPPVGELRFRAPRPATPWSGVRAAVEFGHSAPQNPSFLPGMESGAQSEDCLYLNVYTPRADGALRPVLFWIHGGGFTGGSGGQALYDGGRLAARGDVVVVTINYRLGALGYTTLAGPRPELGSTGPDRRASVRARQHRGVRRRSVARSRSSARARVEWRSRRCSACPPRAGSSAARSRRAAPLITRTAPTARRESGRALLAELGLSPGDTEKLRDVPVPALLAAQARVLAENTRAGGLLAFAPGLDTETLPRHPLEAVRDGAARDVALLVGANRDEMKLFRMGMAASSELDEARTRQAGSSGTARPRRRRVTRAETDRDLPRGAHPPQPRPSPSSSSTRSIPTARSACLRSDSPRPTRRSSHDTYQYLFTWSSPAGAARSGPVTRSSFRSCSERSTHRRWTASPARAPTRRRSPRA